MRDGSSEAAVKKKLEKKVGSVYIERAYALGYATLASVDNGQHLFQGKDTCYP